MTVLTQGDADEEFYRMMPHFEEVPSPALKADEPN
jgi:hypothetical protein